jgi:hypothetical protein
MATSALLAPAQARKKNDTIPLIPLGLLCAGLIPESVNEESFKQMGELLAITHSGNIRYLSEPKARRPADNVCKTWLRHRSERGVLWGSPLEDRAESLLRKRLHRRPERPELRSMALGGRYEQLATRVLGDRVCQDPLWEEVICFFLVVLIEI